MWERFFKKILFNIVIWGIYLLFFFVGYIFWFEYRRDHQDELSRRLKPDTHWVMNKFPVYFVSGDKFGKINLDGSDLKILYKAAFPVEEFVFSPDGRYIVIITSGDILLYDQKLDQIDLVHSLGSLVKEQAAKGLIGSLQWSSNSQKFCYELSRWSDVSSSDQFYVYDLNDKQKKMIQSPPKNIQGVMWDQTTQQLYGYKRDTTELLSSKSFRWEIYSLPFDGSPSQLIRVLQTSKKNLFVSDLQAAGITPFLPRNFSNRVGQKNITWNSPQGKKIGLDEKRCFYYQPPGEEPQKIFCLPDGVLSLIHVRWMPSGRYVIVTHSRWGILVIDPASGKIGRLINGEAFGWYENVAVPNFQEEIIK